VATPNGLPLAEKRQFRLALDQTEDRLLLIVAGDRVSFPITCTASLSDYLGPLVNRAKDSSPGRDNFQG
jgi:hypothetical protein